MNVSPSHNAQNYERCPCSDCWYKEKCASGLACETFRLFVTYGKPADRAIGDMPTTAIWRDLFKGNDDDIQILAHIKQRRSRGRPKKSQALTVD